MLPVHVRFVASDSERRAFIRLPWMIYRNDPNWVPPLLSEISDAINPKKNLALQLGPFAHLIATKNGQVVGRLGVGIDERLNRIKAKSEGYFTLFESIDDYEVSKALFDAAMAWFHCHKITSVTGPQSPSNGDDYRALLVWGLESQPVLMMSYNPPYYANFLEEYGFTKHFDRLAFSYDLTKPVPERFLRLVEVAKARYGIRVDPLDLRNVERDLEDLKKITDVSMPDDWPDIVPPTMDEIRHEANKMLPVAVPDLICIARVEDRPVGVLVALPDYNQVLKHLNGRLFPFGALKFLWLKRRITALRAFVIFVVPEYRRKAVSAAMYLHLFHAARRLGYTTAEGSTIHEFNKRMIADALGAGGVHYKTYRIYKKDV